MSWVYLFLAGLLEIGWALGLKLSDGFSKPWPTTFTIVSLILSMGLLGLALRTLPLGTAYAIWTGIGAVGIAIIGMIWFGDGVTFARIVCIALIVAGIVGLKLSA
ncbi:MAG: multidrug efflux SMR transporter [Pseudomonadota bacterium]|nr:multidrug efflux SMR transporter [Pseudomonadota bacterium]